MSARISHTFPAQREQIGAMRGVSAALIKSWLGSDDLDERGHDLLLALQEAVTNVIKHAYAGWAGADGEEPRVELEFDFAGECVEVSVRDWGRTYDPDQVPEPDFEDPTPGGYGVFIIRSVTDGFSYRREGQCNVLRLNKRFPLSQAMECIP